MLKPVLGFASRTAAVEALLAANMSPGEIAEEIGGTVNSVQVLIAAARNRVGDRRIVLPRELADRLAYRADIRGMTVEHLALRVLEAVVDDDVIDALIGEQLDG